MITLGAHTIDIDLFIFDKDGLLFDNNYFWTALSSLRASKCKDYMTDEQIIDWLAFVGISARVENNNFCIDSIDSSGIFAVAAEHEEISITAAFLLQCTKMPWSQARKCAKEIFLRTDESLNLEKAIKPMPGFPDIFKRLRKATIPYGIATSDNRDRALTTVNMFDDASKLSFLVTPEDVEHGKPNPDMLKLIHEKTKVPFEKMAMVGDSLVDLEMAHSVGAIGIGIPQEETVKTAMLKYSPYIIESLNDIHF